MGRHVRTALNGTGRARLASWGNRVQAALVARGPGGRSTGLRVLREVGVGLGVVATAAGVFVLLFVLSGRPLTPTPGLGTSQLAATLAPATTGAAASVPTAAPTPLPVQAPSTAAPATPPSQGTGAASASDVGQAPAASSTAADAATASTVAAVPAAAVAGPTAPPPSLVPPVPGEALAGFGWAYSPVFADWQEHTGVDLAATVGESVVAPAPGLVTAVRQDALWGGIVSIALDHGYTTNISGLQGITVKAGQAVKAGDTIGQAADSPPAEANLAPHVFWQLFAGTEAVDPTVR